MRNTVKKILCVAAAAVAAANVFAGCSGEKPSGGGDKTQTQETLVSRICTLDSGKTYLEVDGKPFAIRGAQIRTDALVNRAPEFENALPAATYEEIDGYFAAAAELGFNTVEIPHGSGTFKRRFVLQSAYGADKEHNRRYCGNGQRPSAH